MEFDTVVSATAATANTDTTAVTVTTAAIVATAVIAIGALAMSVVVFFRERKDAQLRVFTDFTTTATMLFTQKKDFEAVNKHFEWAITLLNHLEYFAYLVNNKKLPKEYAKLYKPHINSWYTRIVDGELKEYLEHTPKKFEELKKLYKELNK